MQGTWENGQFVLAATKDSQIERLRAENKAAWDSAEHNAKRARAAEATIERLREYVEHVGHTRSCAYIRWLDNDFDGDDEEKPCDCGYDALMAELEGSK